MSRHVKWLFFIAGGIFTLVLVGGILFLFTRTAAANATDASVRAGAAMWHVGRSNASYHIRGDGVLTGYEENLAEALGITVEELRSAQEAAFNATLEEAVADGRITQEDADLMLAYHALMAYIDHEALLAEALGISVEELRAAFDEGKTLQDLIEEAGLDQETFREYYQAANEAAVQQAVEDGVITQEQADQILSNPGRGFRGFGGFFGGRGMRGYHGPGGDGRPNCPNDDPSDDT